MICNGLHFRWHLPGRKTPCNVHTMVDGPLVPFDAGKPNLARGYNYALGGKDHFAVDREQHAEVMEVFPLAEVLVRENREFLARAVSYVAGQGVTQFIDVGSGLPASPGIHEIAGLACADARVAYVDNDPVVIAHTAAMLASPGRVAAVPGDVRCPGDILASTALASVIDVSRPFCVILAVILDYVEPAQAAGIVAAFRHAMPAGSFLVLSIGVNDNAPDVARDVIKAFRAAQVHLHGRDQVAGYLAGLEVVEPGLTEARRWRPAQPPAADDPRPADIRAGVGRKADRG
jgi:S-adenosyl methyltransferase